MKKHIFRTVGCLVMGLTLTGCPFEFGDPPKIPSACTDDSDCRLYETCSASNGACVLATPDYQPNRVIGPFNCNIDGGGTLGGTGFRVQWTQPVNTVSGLSFPAGEAGLNHSCRGVVLEEESNKTFWRAVVQGPRVLLGDDYYFLLMYLTISTEIFETGSFGVAEAAGMIDICPGFPADAAWNSLEAAIDNCEQLFQFGRGVIIIDEVSVDTSQRQYAIGYLDMELYP